MFQFYNLIPSLTARENVALVTDIASAPMPAAEALELVGLGERLDHFPRSSRAASSSGWPSRAPSPSVPTCCCATSRGLGDGRDRGSGKAREEADARGDLVVSHAWDAIVIGSGIGGLACAAALAPHERRVLVLERHEVAGGLTQTFSRDGYTWDVGVHYLGDMAPGRPARRVLDWLSGRTIEMAPLGAVYDTVRFPGDFRVPVLAPRGGAARRPEGEVPGKRARDRCLPRGDRSRRARGDGDVCRTLDARHARRGLRLAAGKQAAPLVGRTTAEVLGELIGDPRLRSVLAAAWGDHGGRPAEGSFGMQAVVMRHYLNGAWYPVGGAGMFAALLEKRLRQQGARCEPPLG